MKRWWKIQGILWKQYLVRNKGGLIILAVCMFFLLFFRLTGKGEGEAYQGIKVGVCYEDERGRELCSRLQGKAPSGEEKGLTQGIFRFLPYEKEEDLKRDVENGRLECGYVFPQGFYEKLQKGRMRNRILLYYSEGSSAHRISYEIVFSHLFSMLSEEILKGFAGQMSSWQEGGLVSEEAAAEELLQLKKVYEENGSTFSVIFETAKGRQQQAGEPKEPVPLSPVRGCIGVGVFFMSLLGLAGSRDMEGLLSGLPGGYGRRLREGSLQIGIGGSILIGAALLAASGLWQDMERELLALFLYFLVLQVFLHLLAVFLKTPERVYGAIPFLILGSLILCPVFIRIEAYVPLAAGLNKLFPPSYYLSLFL